MKHHVSQTPPPATIAATLFIIFLISAFRVHQVHAVQSIRPFNNDAGLFNPNRGPVTIGYQLFKDADQVEVRVIDFRGQVVNRFTFVDLRAGDQSYTWDGTDSNEERVVDGRYQFLIEVNFTDDSHDIAAVDIMVAVIESSPGIQVPEPLPAEEFPHRISGSLSTFYRYNSDLPDDRDDGEVRFRTRVDYKDEQRTLRGVFQVLQDYDGSAATFNGTQAMAEQRWNGGKAKGVFRDSLGNFTDLIQLFSDFKTERNKLGFLAEQNYGNISATGLAFTSEGDIDSREQGAAARLSYGVQESLTLGAGYTFRRAEEDYFSDERTDSHAAAVDMSYSAFSSLIIAAEAVATDDALIGNDYGYFLNGTYDLGSIRLSAGYSDLGEHLQAAYADPLHNVARDAAGFDASIDYFMNQPMWNFSSFSATLRFFNLTRHSDESTIREIDASMRFGLGDNDTFFMSLFKRQDEFGNNTSFMANSTHAWNDIWSTLLQANYTESDSSESIRFTLTNSYTQNVNTGRLSLEWTRRTLELSKFSPYDQSYLRLDLGNELWHLQLQTKYSQNGEESGLNFFGRIDYKPAFLHRYQIVSYCSYGDRAALSTENQWEIGLEVQF